MEETDEQPLFQLETMPCETAAAREALQEIIDNGQHVFSPLPAIDTALNPIPPWRYEEMLRGATVLVSFVLSCERCAEGLQFYMDIESLYVARQPNPPSIELSATKSLSKRRRFAVPEVVKKAKASA
jgi:hypothetical protein